MRNGEIETTGGIRVQWPVSFGWSAIGALFVAVVLGTTYVITEDARVTRLEAEVDILREDMMGQRAQVAAALAAIDQVDRKMDVMIERMDWILRYVRVDEQRGGGDSTIPYIPWGAAPE